MLKFFFDVDVDVLLMDSPTPHGHRPHVHPWTYNSNYLNVEYWHIFTLVMGMERTTVPG